MKPAQGVWLWTVRVKGRYGSSERDGSGTSAAFDRPFYVVARSSREARQEAKAAIEQFVKGYGVYDDYRIEATTVDMDSLVVTYHTSGGWSTSETLRPVELGGTSGRRYRLAVVLVEA